MQVRNILMIIPNFGFGGAQRSFSTLSLELAKTHRVFIIVFNTNTDYTYAHGGHLINLNVAAGNGLTDKIKKFFERVRKVKALKKKYNIDISISFLEGADYVNILSRHRDKVVISIRGSKDSDETITGFLAVIRKKFLIPWLYNKPDHIVALNNGIKHELRHIFYIRSSVPVTCIYNYFDIKEIEHKAKEKLTESYQQIFTGRVLISHGRLAVEKGYNYLIQVFQLLLRQHPDLKLVLVGDGPFKNTLYTECSRLHLNYFTWEQPGEDLHDKRVFFLGFDENPFKYLARATVFVMTSSSEGFGNSIAEAMACGLPVVSTDCPSGPREILAPATGRPKNAISKPETAEFGVLMPLLKGHPNNVKVWANAIAGILDDINLLDHYRKKSQERIWDFTKEEIFGQWQHVIKELLKKGEA